MVGLAKVACNNHAYLQLNWSLHDAPTSAGGPSRAPAPRGPRTPRAGWGAAKASGARDPGSARGGEAAPPPVRGGDTAQEEGACTGASRILEKVLSAERCTIISYTIIYIAHHYMDHWCTIFLARHEVHAWAVQGPTLPREVCAPARSSRARSFRLQSPAGDWRV